MRSMRRLTVAAVLCLFLAGCGGGAAGTTSARSSNPARAFTGGFLAFQNATNEMANATTPLAEKVSANRGSSARMSEAFITMGRRETGLAARWYPAIVAFEALRPPPGLASLFAAATSDATKLYASLRLISHQAATSSRILTARQFVAGGRDLQVFSTRARALGADFDKLAQHLGLS